MMFVNILYSLLSVIMDFNHFDLVAIVISALVLVDGIVRISEVAMNVAL